MEAEWYSPKREQITHFGIRERKFYTFEIAPEAYWFYYKEPTLDVKSDGVMYGGRAIYTQRFAENPINFRAEGRFAAGKVNYDGFLSDNTPHQDSGTDWTVETQGLFGYDWKFGETTFTPFAGGGFRYLKDLLESANAYERDVMYLYTPAGRFI